ncbi:hypothetical protein DYH56_07065 [Psychrilyobacter piezotolerans]|uniref:Uncharacterized protein n=1 Tax=Psychrilyobacter piezotolerans TaxID=2293438 RepID=A0ABX9KHN6_9FUSO|nr:hypothetical protein DV867_07065 [Psychrilyobacter sp. S5]REI41422.1 hypothetical protein DYH56_07065 [Psychrilyobacter piezotolerans]
MILFRVCSIKYGRILLNLIKLSSNNLIFGITDNSAIKVTSTLEFFGDVYLLDRGKILKLKGERI